MKKLLFLFAASLLCYTTVSAQANLKTFQSDITIHKAGLDSTSGTTGATQFAKTPGYFEVATIQTVVKKLTGTPGGTVKLYGSIDGANYDVAAPDSLIVTNVALQVKTWTVKPAVFQWYKVIYKPTGTQTSTIATKGLFQKFGQ